MFTHGSQALGLFYSEGCHGVTPVVAVLEPPPPRASRTAAALPIRWPDGGQAGRSAARQPLSQRPCRREQGGNFAGSGVPNTPSTVNCLAGQYGARTGALDTYRETVQPYDRNAIGCATSTPYCIMRRQSSTTTRSRIWQWPITRRRWFRAPCAGGPGRGPDQLSLRLRLPAARVDSPGRRKRRAGRSRPPHLGRTRQAAPRHFLNDVAMASALLNAGSAPVVSWARRRIGSALAL
jgi:hypothetical protein